MLHPLSDCKYVCNSEGDFWDCSYLPLVGMDTTPIPEIRIYLVEIPESIQSD